MSSPVRLVVLLALLAFPGSAGAATFSVTKTADTADGTCDADCSLREAVAAANANSDEDTITFAVTATHPIGNPLSIANPLTITGQGSGASGTVLDGGGAGRIFTITGNVAVTISQLRMTGGQAGSTGGGGDEGGSAIGHATGALALDRVVVTGNNVDGTGGFGGAVRTTNGTLTITDSTIANNSVAASTANANGGGIAVYGGSLNLIRSTVSANSVDPTQDGDGAGIYVGGSATITNSTISNNHSGGGAAGIMAEGGPVAIINSTITANDTAGTDILGGGIFTNTPAVTIRNSIVSGNLQLPSTPSNCLAVSSGSIVNSGGNVENGTTCGFGAAKNPLLSVLGSLGGMTQTHLPQVGSQALDIGVSCPAGNDQRGKPRTIGAACDAGAVELDPPTATTSPATSVGTTTATLNGTVVNNEMTGAVSDFEYGTTTAYGSTTSPQQAVAAGATVPHSASLTGLSPGTTYHFRVVISGSAGTVFGADQTFTTASASSPGAPTPGGSPPSAELPAQTGGPTVLLLGGKPLFDGGSVVDIDVAAPGAGQIRGELTLLGKQRAVSSAKKRKPKKIVLGAATLTVTAAGTVKLTVPLNAAAKRRLGGGRKVKAKLTVTFTPAGGGKKSSKSTTVTLKRKKP